MTNKTIKTILALAVIFTTALSQADVLLIERVESKANLTLPSKSQTMEQVQVQFGDPLSQTAAVGEPPITQWAYAEFVVYFEHSHVITTVIKKSKATEIGPKSIDKGNIEQDSTDQKNSEDTQDS